MRKAAVIVAGGKGSRAGRDLPKQFVEIAGKPMIFHTLKAFKDHDPEMEIVVVMNEEYREMYEEMVRSEGDSVRYMVVAGGATRAESVKAGLECLRKDRATEGDDLKVAIHDAARPLVTEQMIRCGFDSVRPGYGAVPVVPVVSSLRRLTAPVAKKITEQTSMTVDRAEYVEIQTPQVFRYSDIILAYDIMDDPKRFTDDASVAEAAGLGITLYPGDPVNLKVTNPIDFVIAETLLNGKEDR